MVLIKGSTILSFHLITKMKNAILLVIVWIYKYTIGTLLCVQFIIQGFQYRHVGICHQQQYPPLRRATHNTLMSFIMEGSG